jgi:hypothetical protein
VGLPRESRTSRPCTLTIWLMPPVKGGARGDCNVRDPRSRASGGRPLNEGRETRP